MSTETLQFENARLAQQLFNNEPRKTWVDGVSTKLKVLKADDGYTVFAPQGALPPGATQAGVAVPNIPAIPDSRGL